MPSKPLQRLRQRAQFDVVLADRPVAKTQHFALHVAATTHPESPSTCFPHGGHWLGVVVPKRWAKRAVTRSLLRRQIYATGHDMLARLPVCAMVVRLRSAFSPLQFPSASSAPLRQLARQELMQLFAKVAHA